MDHNDGGSLKPNVPYKDAPKRGGGANNACNADKDTVDFNMANVRKKLLITQHQLPRHQQFSIHVTGPLNK